jgi:PIN domain nuclease of toxin-antitoxin system
VRFLLDTHLVLAVVNGTPERLSEAHCGILSDPSHDFVASAASLWEIAIKFRLGKLPLRIEPGDLSAYLEASEISVLPVTAEHATIEALPVPQTRDPFDRLLLAVAQIEEAALLTTDSRLVIHPLTWPTRPA